MLSALPGQRDCRMMMKIFNNNTMHLQDLDLHFEMAKINVLITIARRAEFEKYRLGRMLFDCSGNADFLHHTYRFIIWGGELLTLQRKKRHVRQKLKFNHNTRKRNGYNLNAQGLHDI